MAKTQKPDRVRMVRIYLEWKDPSTGEVTRRSSHNIPESSLSEETERFEGAGYTVTDNSTQTDTG